MNEQNPTPPIIPIAAEDPTEPIPHAIAAIEALLRQPLRLSIQLRKPGAGRLIGQMLLITIGCSLVYGVVVGTFAGGPQLWAAPAKIAGGLILSAGICLPSLYIFTCLSGSRARFVEVCGFLAGLLMLMTILLVGFAPVAWIFSQSTDSAAWMGGLHLAFWGIATLFGVRFLKQGFSRTEAKSQAGVNIWVIIFLLVALQMTTALRPIVGKSDTFFPAEKEFFIAHWANCLIGKGSIAKPNPSN
ncbi:MAG TPA: hypothetical protein VH280_14350 [Verrucomicrobiae bacterium]|jgi:hypothetical protein|nr:hypothetical protein [Verrucomicrobiae bacterium]